MAAKKTKPAKRKPAASKSKAKTGKATQVPNHRFAPGTKVSFLPAHTITVERSLQREPFAKPVKTAEVGDDGTLEVAGLDHGQWCAAGPVEDGARWAYVAFSVKE